MIEELMILKCPVCGASVEINEGEISAICEYCRSKVIRNIRSNIDNVEVEEDDADPFLEEAIEVAIEIGQVDTAFIQRKFDIGYARAGRIIDQMEARGIISSYAGSKPREVLITKKQWKELNMSSDSTFDD